MTFLRQENLSVLKSSNKDLQVLFPQLAANAETAFLVVDKEHSILEINESAKRASYKAIGKKPKRGESLYSFIYPHFKEALKRDIENCFLGDSVKKVLKAPDGIGFSYVLKRVQVGDQYVVSLESISEKNFIKDKEVFQNANVYLDNLFNLTSTGIKISDVNGNILQVNNAYQGITGYSQKDFEGKTILYALDESERALATEQLTAFVQSGITPKRDWVMRHANGSKLYVDLSINKVLVQGEYKIIYSITDLTKQHKLEEDLKQSKLQMDALVNNLSVMLWSVDANLKFVTANKCAKSHLKKFLNFDFKKGAPLAKVFGTDDEIRDKRLKEYKEVITSREVKKFDTVGFKNGQLHHFEGEMHPIIENDIVVGVSCFMENNTADFLRKTLSRGLSRFSLHCAKANSVKEVFRHLANDVLTKLYIEEGEIMLRKGDEMVSEVMYRDGLLFDPHSKSEGLVMKVGEGLIGACVQEGLTFVVADSEVDKRVITIGRSFKSEIAVPIMVRGSVYAVINCESKYKGFFKPIFKEVLESAAKEAGDQIRKLLDEEELEETQLYFSSILNSTPNSFLLIDKDLNILSYNKRAAQVFPKFWNGIQVKKGISYLNFVANEDEDKFRKAVNQGFNGKLLTVEHKLTHPKFGEKWLSITFAPALNKHEKVFGVTLILKDITEAKSVENYTIQQNFELKKANRELDQFVYSISHDVRAPLSSIQGLSGLIAMADNLDEIKEYNGYIHDSTKKLDSLIRNILDYSRNKRKANLPEWIDTQSIIKQSIQSQQYLPNFERLSMRLDLPKMPVFVDPFRFRLIVDALISNAIKYQDLDKNESILNIMISQNTEGLHLKFKDNGQGIKKELLKNVFDMFVTANAKAQGNGIGMYILKETVDFLQGEVKVTSTFGEHTTVNINLPNFSETGTIG